MLLPPDLFADYAPRAADQPRPRLEKLIIRLSTLEDRPALAEIAWRRNGGRLEEYQRRFERDLANLGNPLDALWLTADVSGQVAGYGKISWLDVDPASPPNAAPAGYYLGGVTVRPEYRRRGIGHELTRQRMKWIAQQNAAVAYYFVNAQNRASIALHAPFGFVEVTRDFFVPGASFVGGVGILFRSDLSESTWFAPAPTSGVPPHCP